MQTNYIGKKVIVRAKGAGVFYGTLKEKEGDEVVLNNARRIYYWKGASECLELAAAGCDGSSKLTRTVDEVMIENVLEIHPCSDVAIHTIEAMSYRIRNQE